MKLVTAVCLFPDAAADAALRDTLALCNQAANTVSAVAFAQHIRSRQALQRKTYRDLKDMGLSAQPAIHITRKVAAAEHADVNAAKNIAARGALGWADVMQPHAA